MNHFIRIMPNDNNYIINYLERYYHIRKYKLFYWSESQWDYDEHKITYRYPCGKGTVVWSKERPNGNGSGYQAPYTDLFVYCKDCENTLILVMESQP